jgi:hypothetical protein
VLAMAVQSKQPLATLQDSMIYFRNLYCIPVSQSQLDPHIISSDPRFCSLAEPDFEFPPLYVGWVFSSCHRHLFVFN